MPGKREVVNCDLDHITELGNEGVKSRGPSGAVRALEIHELDHRKQGVTGSDPDTGLYFVRPILGDRRCGDLRGRGGVEGRRSTTTMPSMATATPARTVSATAPEPRRALRWSPDIRSSSSPDIGPSFPEIWRSRPLHPGEGGATPPSCWARYSPWSKVVKLFLLSGPRGARGTSYLPGRARRSTSAFRAEPGRHAPHSVVGWQSRPECLPPAASVGIQLRRGYPFPG